MVVGGNRTTRDSAQTTTKRIIASSFLQSRRSFLAIEGNCPKTVLASKSDIYRFSSVCFDQPLSGENQPEMSHRYHCCGQHLEISRFNGDLFPKRYFPGSTSYELDWTLELCRPKLVHYDEKGEWGVVGGNRTTRFGTDQKKKNNCCVFAIEEIVSCNRG